MKDLSSSESSVPVYSFTVSLSVALGRVLLVKLRYRSLECSFWKGGKKECPLDKSLNSLKCFLKLHIFLECLFLGFSFLVEDVKIYLEGGDWKVLFDFTHFTIIFLTPASCRLLS